MAKRSKRYLTLKEKIDKNKQYTPLEAIKLVKETSNSHFDESIEVAIPLNIKPKEKGERVRGTVILPQGTGKKVKVVVFAQGDKAREAEGKGADYVGAEEIAKKIEGGWLDFDVAVSTPGMMKIVARLGKILGPRGLMPSPKVGTVSDSPGELVEELKKGRIEYRNDVTGVVHVLMGKVSFSEEALLENLKVLLASLIKDKPSTVKGRYIKSISLCSTMGPGVKIKIDKALEIL